MLTASAAFAESSVAVVQPMVCAASSSRAVMAQSALPPIVSESGDGFFQMGGFMFTPGSFPSDVAMVAADVLPMPRFEGKMLDVTLHGGSRSIVTVYALNGECVKLLSTAGSSITIPVQELPEVMIVRVQTGMKRAVFKLVRPL